MSFELPFTSIKRAASVLLTAEIEKEEDRRELLTIIDEESERIDKLESQAVELAQLDAQQGHMTMGRLISKEWSNRFKKIVNGYGNNTQPKSESDLERMLSLMQNL
jgi:signal transduction histidine kinase